MNKIICGDARNMHQIEDNSVNLVVTSPPYNANITYDNSDDNLSREDYLNLLYNVWKECYRVLTDDGRICINICNIHKPYQHNTGDIARQLEDLGFTLRGEIVWFKDLPVNSSSAWGSFNSPSNPALRDKHEYIIIAYKKHAKLQRKGKSDLIGKEFIRYTCGEWHIRPVNVHQKHGHPVPFPLELPRRCIKLYSYIGDVVLDPFVGSGTTCLAAKELRRQYIGIDISKKYCEIAHERCKQEFIWKWGKILNDK